MNLFTKKDIKRFGFIYEPDKTKCKSLKLRLYVPKLEMIDEDYKKEIAKQIPYKYVHLVIKSPNPYEDDPDFLADPRVLVIGHGQIDII